MSCHTCIADVASTSNIYQAYEYQCTDRACHMPINT